MFPFVRFSRGSLAVDLGAFRFVHVVRSVVKFVAPGFPEWFSVLLRCSDPLCRLLVGPCSALWILAGKSLIALLIFVVFLVTQI